MKLLQISVFAVLSSLAFSLTETDMENFSSSTHIETNTGLQGYVIVYDDGNGNWVITGNDIPDHDTGSYTGDKGTNQLLENEYTYTVTQDPVIAENETCLPPGPIGVATNGVLFFNPWTSKGKNAIRLETFDLCDGHPTPLGVYHYHKMPSSCLFTIEKGVPSPLIGVALDGFGIYGPVDETGVTLKSSDLDDCHGRLNSDGVYQYHATEDFPYVLGCFTGTPNIRSKLLTGEKCYYARDADPETGDAA